MKIAIISTSYHPYNIGGGEYSVKNLAEGLQKKGIQIIVIAAYTKNVIETIDGIKVYRIKSPNIYWAPLESKSKPLVIKAVWHLIEAFNPFALFRIKRILRNEKIDIIHIRNITNFSSSIWLSKYWGIPNITTLNNYASICTRATMFKSGGNCETQCLICKIVSFPKKLASYRVNYVVGVSDSILQEHLRMGFFKNAKKRVIYTSSAANRHVLPYIVKNEITLGFIGQIIPSKGIEVLIRAYIESGIDNKLIIAGEGDSDYKSKCQKLSADYNVHFIGKIKSQEFYKIVDIIIIPSIWREPFPRVIVEAMAFGRPVIGSRNGGTSEFIKDGYNGYTYKTDSELVQLLKQISSMTVEDLKQLHENSIKFINSKNSDELDNYIDAYNELVK